MNLETLLHEMTASWQYLARSGNNPEYVVFPKRGGLLPFGVTSNGDILFWKTVGSPDAWTVVIEETSSRTVEYFSTGLAEFLLSVFTGAVRPEALDGLVPTPRPRFVQAKAPA
jgi:hypothetical protein